MGSIEQLEVASTGQQSGKVSRKKFRAVGNVQFYKVATISNLKCKLDTLHIEYRGL